MNMSERIAFALNSSGKQPRDLAKEIGISVARISQLKAGTGGIKAENLFAFARATHCSPRWLAEGVGKPKEDDNPLKDFTIIPQYSAKGAAGNGYLNENVEKLSGLVFKRDWLNRMRLKEQNLKVIYTQGSSMEPTLADGDVLLIDESQIEPSNRRIYAITRPDGELIIKRLMLTMTNGWIIRSDNEDKRQYPDEIASDNEIGHLRIVGRVVWHGGAL
ncbi:S24 family peptidase [Pseudomonas sp. FSL R10-0765]|uniref:XRE family transcriptional regulator n=1 Tax=Pseudomonas sp. FSL R10-0765 TaxID=2662195 RepID=UPI0015B5A476|nr:S24 family peptidase [Pseudomonas sp. FSL R10-0765]